MAITDTFDGAASMLTHGGAAQDFLIQIALPYASAYYSAALKVLEPVAYLGLIACFIMWFVFQNGQIKSFFVSLCLAVILLLPGNYQTGDSALWFSSAVPSNPADVTGNSNIDIEYPRSIVVFFNVVGVLERGLYSAVNTAMAEFDGSLSEGVLPSRILSIANDSMTLATASPELVSLHRLYRSSCQTPASKLGLSTTAMQALGFHNSIMIGIDDGDVIQDPEHQVSFWRSLWPMSSRIHEVSGDSLSNTELSKIKASASESGVFLASGSLIPSSRYFSAREQGASPDSNSFLTRAEVSGTQFEHPNPSAASADQARFYASDCDELHDMVQLGNRQYYAFIKGIETDRGDLVSDSSAFSWLRDVLFDQPQQIASLEVEKLAEASYMNGMVPLNRAVSEANGYQSLGGNNRGDTSNGFLDAGVKSLGLGLSALWKEWRLDLAPAAVNSVVAMGMALLFIMLPLVIVFSVLPGRISTLGTIIKVILFGKLTLLLMYITCKLSLIASSASMFSVQTMSYMPTSLYAAQVSLAVASQLIALIVLLTAAPMLAYFIVFSETKGLSSLKPDSIGSDAARNAMIAAGAATQVATRVGGKAVGYAVNNSRNLGQIEDDKNRQSSPGRGVPAK
ncbi:hypothetical protein J7355_16695 [Endozoicomonas sp. G2_2]|uniref:hypothetical protein n=1 Tax=Endozoicomonas sp. G2_2 TaxID=2821092 RepID=UPI001ADCD40C|nr:hypothetical protein [Endozoicomonas sp. G2_2]MBO9471731.1 hypothetical protein [Endozoicomonas sp. G2_2]